LISWNCFHHVEEKNPKIVSMAGHSWERLFMHDFEIN